MIFKNALFFLILYFICSGLFNGKIYSQNDTLAIVDGKPITSDDFINRFELSVYPGKGLNEDLNKVKLDFLYSLIAEKLLSNKSSNSVSDPDPNEKYLKNEIEMIFLRDALYHKEVLSKVKVTPKELKTGIKYSSYSYIVDAFYFPDSLWADSFLKRIKNKDSKYIYHLADSLNLCHDTLRISYGESDETIENAFFDHNIGFNSKPTNTVDGWVVFRILDKNLNEKFSSLPPAERSKKVNDIISNRIGYRIGRDYLLSVMKGVTVNVNYKIFTPLVYKIKSILATHRPAGFDKGYYLSREELLNLKNTFSYDPRAPMLKFKGMELSLGYIFDNLSLAGFAPPDTSVSEITYSLHMALRFIVQNYFLAQRAKSLGMELSPEVKYNTQMFLDAYLSNKISDEIMDTVKISENEINNYFETHKDEVLKDIMLRLQIFSFDNLDEAVTVLNRLNHDRNSRQDTTGAVWLHAYQLSEIGAVIAQLNNGDTYGPLLLKGKYTIFRLLDKRSKISQREISNSLQMSKEMLINQMRREAIDKYLAKLAGEQSVKIFKSNLKNVSVTPIQMLTFRYIGFGGKIIAVPSLYPREDWINYMKDDKNIFP